VCGYYKQDSNMCITVNFSVIAIEVVFPVRIEGVY